MRLNRHVRQIVRDVRYREDDTMADENTAGTGDAILMVTPELMAKARTATDAGELAAIAAEEGHALSEEQAQMLFARLQGEKAVGELADEELDDVSGGCGSSGGSGTYGVCPMCGRTIQKVGNQPARCSYCASLGF